jgi:hypothetical protein
MVLLTKDATIAGADSGAGTKIVSFERRLSIFMHLSDAYKSDAYKQDCRDGKSNYHHPRDFRVHRMPP